MLVNILETKIRVTRIFGSIRATTYFKIQNMFLMFWKNAIMMMLLIISIK